MENSMEVSQNMKAELPNDSAGLFLHTYRKKWNDFSKSYLQPMLYCSVIHKVRVWKQRQHTHTGILFNREKETIPREQESFCNNIDMLSEISQQRTK